MDREPPFVNISNISNDAPVVVSRHIEGSKEGNDFGRCGIWTNKVDATGVFGLRRAPRMVIGGGELPVLALKIVRGDFKPADGSGVELGFRAAVDVNDEIGLGNVRGERRDTNVPAAANVQGGEPDGKAWRRDEGLGERDGLVRLVGGGARP